MLKWYSLLCGRAKLHSAEWPAAEPIKCPVMTTRCGGLDPLWVTPKAPCKRELVFGFHVGLCNRRFAAARPLRREIRFRVAQRCRELKLRNARLTITICL